MKDILKSSENNCFLPADILLPVNAPEKWSVIACDQYTSEPEYWERVREYVGNAPSAFNIIFPEARLSDNNEEKIASINANMRKYLDGGVFKEYKNTFVYTERTLNDGKVRHGIVGLIDLCDYSYEKQSRTLIRATEETVTSRIPVRVEIRKDAPLEMPHVMLLIDDPEGTVIEPLKDKADGFDCLYDFELMLNGGHIKGSAVDADTASEIQSALYGLTEKSDDKLLFVVGDGNHSLAAAKECYNLNKTEASRYALVEVVNIHDSSLEFEPIYRVLFGVDPENVINGFSKALGGEYHGEDAQKFICVFGENERIISVKPTAKLAVGTLQEYLDGYLKKNPDVTIDYVHGTESARALAKEDNTLAFIFDGMEKHDLFDAVKQDGSLPRKTFSMGHADDKRFYLECRSLDR